VEESYRKGELLTGELKKMAITLLQEYVKGFQERRKDVTEEILRQFMKPRKLEWKGNPNPKPKETKPKVPKEEKEAEKSKA
jgi:tryptophanyl-tRNA synthetase